VNWLTTEIIALVMAPSLDAISASADRTRSAGIMEMKCGIEDAQSMTDGWHLRSEINLFHDDATCSSVNRIILIDPSAKWYEDHA